MKLDDPMNASIVKELLLPGIPELQSSTENARKKVLAIIQKLLAQQPIVPAPPPPGMPPMPTQPSIAPEPEVDDPVLFVQLLREWMGGKIGMRSAESNAEGYENVKAYLRAQMQLAAPPPMPLPPGGPSEGQGETPAGGPPPPAGKDTMGPPPNAMMGGAPPQ